MAGLSGEEAIALAQGYTDNSIKGITGVLAGKNCTVKDITDNVVTFEWTADDGTKKTGTMVVEATTPPEQIEEEVAQWLEDNKDDIKGEDGKGVTVGSVEEFAQNDDAILNFDPNEVITGDNFYNKVQSDVKFAKSVDVGDVTTLVVSTWEDLVEAINTTWLAGAGGFNFDAERRILEIQTRGGQIINIDVSQIILSTNITDFRDMFVLNVLDGQSLVWNATRQKWVNKSIDASAVLDEAKAYTDDKVTKMNDAEAIACDEEPTFYGGIVTYKRGGETLQIEVSTKKIFFYYLDEDGNATQKIWVDGTPFTISMGGDFDLSDYVPKEDIIDEFDEEFLDLSKVPNTAYMKGFKDWLEVNGAGSAESVVVTEIPTHPEWKTVQNALDGIIAKIEYVKPSITSFTATPSTTIYEKGQKVASLVFKWVLNKAVTTQTLTGCTLADASVREATYNTEISAKKTFTLNVSDGENSASANFTVDFQNKIYSGSASEGTYNSAFILGLATKKFATAKSGTYSMTVGAGQYGYIAYPKSMGQISSVKIGGFDTDMVNCGDVQFTNASGYTETYNIVRTGRSGLGAISMVVA